MTISKTKNILLTQPKYFVCQFPSKFRTNMLKPEICKNEKMEKVMKNIVKYVLNSSFALLN